MIPIPSQPVFALSPEGCMLIGEATNTVNSEIIAMFLLMRKMRQDVCHINENSHFYFSL